MKKLLSLSFLHAAGVTAYVAIVASIIVNGEAWFGPAMGFWGPALVLMLLTLSAAIVGSLIFARPALWALSGQKKEALQLLLFTLAWLAVMVIIAFIIIAQIQ